VSQPIRTFIAIEVSPEIRAQAVKLVRLLRNSDAKIRWVESENMHFTLKFLGNISEVDVYGVCRGVEKAVGRMAPFQIDVRQVGAFPSIQRPHTLWMGASSQEPLSNEEAPIIAAFSAIEHQLQLLGYRRESRRYQPHLTIGRVIGRGQATENLTALLADNAEFQAGGMFVEEVTIFSSTLHQEGPTYEVMGRVPLRGE